MGKPSTPKEELARPLRSREDLLEPFLHAEKPAKEQRFGLEMERFGVRVPSFSPVPYEGDASILSVFEQLIATNTWRVEREAEGGPVVSLKHGESGVTLEPGAQLEFSGSPWPDLFAARKELVEHLQRTAEISAPLGIRWLATGFHPFARLEELPWVPKLRYPIMRQYLPGRGPAALDMMQRTATLQLNLDYESERDALDKLLVSLKLSPFVNALFANSPFQEGHLTSHVSLRGRVWLSMDPERSGLIRQLWEHPKPGYADYIEWALDAGMFFIKRKDRVLLNSGQPFRDFLEHGFQGEQATLADWKLHLNTLFPEARLKSTLELRSSDTLPPELGMAMAAFWSGLFADEAALAEAVSQTARLRFEEVEKARPALVERGLFGCPALEGAELCSSLLEVAKAGLVRRKRLNEAGEDESVLLLPMAELLRERTTPAARAAAGLASGPVPKSELLARTELLL